MSKLRKILLIAAFVGGLGATTPAEAAAGRPVAKNATALTHAEIHSLYGQKSWIWKDGAGYFSVRERRFTAWSKENGSPSYGVGRWFITGPGKLCFKADWHAKSGSAPATTCFSHRKVRGVIYQKREPDGQWYVFRNAPAQESDEFAKLRRGNYVSARVGKIESRIQRAN
ncbi:DUF995 domain-containing protein [Sinorhizobium numidicum]|uniref:DUF995 domain-containing protein n=1 Tax=Sinorhizobium numidicum TaxID=680248 RepID=A0ABY8CQN0_9HYPH|nr:DUF995 domain-containing protein [Sinorhizobium numidicum]WEX74975.1 DUF995 domain-containing protein [Sinorhizobium numidicum]WEX80969.1 DUF995 domain-containing protein [Sinorhizobium numidicum]